jgi:hypothetical protein
MSELNVPMSLCLCGIICGNQIYVRGTDIPLLRFRFGSYGDVSVVQPCVELDVLASAVC